MECVSVDGLALLPRIWHPIPRATGREALYWLFWAGSHVQQRVSPRNGSLAPKWAPIGYNRPLSLTTLLEYKVSGA